MKNTINKIKSNKYLRIIYKTLKAITTLFIVLIVSIIFVQRISNNKVTVGGYSVFTIITESMVPKYQVGDMLLSKKIPTSEIKVGDDVVYMGKSGTFEGKIVTHRVVKIEKKGNELEFHTKGIANTIEDPVVSENQIYGVVTTKLSILSLLSKLVNNIYGFYFIIFVPFAVMIFLEVIDIIHEKEKKN